MSDFLSEIAKELTAKVEALEAAEARIAALEAENREKTSALNYAVDCFQAILIPFAIAEAPPTALTNAARNGLNKCEAALSRDKGAGK